MSDGVNCFLSEIPPWPRQVLSRTLNHVPVHDLKDRVWHAISTPKITGPFFDEKNSERYARLI
jgi:hypothetical protein